MSGDILAFGVLGAGSMVASFVAFRPQWRQYRTIRRFRRQLGHLEVMTAMWRPVALRPEIRDEDPAVRHKRWRTRESERQEGDDEGPALV